MLIKEMIESSLGSNFPEFSEQKVNQVFAKGKEYGLSKYCKTVLKDKFPDEEACKVTRAGNKVAETLYKRFIYPTVVTKSTKL